MSSAIMQLKLQKRLLLEELTAADTKIQRYNEIASKKLLQKSKSNSHIMIPAEHTMTYTGLPVDHFRIPARSCKVSLKPLGTVQIDDREPSTISSVTLLRIRQEQARIKRMKSEADKLAKEKEISNAKILRKENKVFRPPPVQASLLPLRYARSELPCTIEHGFSGHYLSWACPLHNLDYEFYLPFFFDGLQCKEYPLYFLARQGVEDLLFASKGHPEWIIPCIPNLIVPIRNAFFKMDPFTTLGALKAFQQLLECNPGIGEACLPYAKQILTPIKPLFGNTKSMGDRIDYGQRKNDDVGGQVLRTLEIMEEQCGTEALAMIKIIIPLYESCTKK